MKKYLFIITMFVAFSTINILAQEKPDTSSHHGKEPVSQVKDSSVVSETTEEAQPWNKVCPVMGNKINPKVGTVTFEGKAYGFCCAGCDAKFAKNPEKYSKNLNENGTRFIGKK